MAELVLGAVTKNLVNEALSLATEEFSLVWRLKDDLQILAGEIEFIQALIADADNKDIQSAAVQLCLKRLKPLTFDVENVLEEYKYELLRRRKVNTPQKKWDKVRSLFSPVKRLAFRLKMSHKIKDNNSQLKNVKEQGTSYGWNPSEFLNTSSELKEDRLTSPSVQEKEIVGRDDDVIKVVDMLVIANKEEIFAVIGIVGMPGQGKTVLAQLVYKDDKVVNHFERGIWICVSEDFKVQRVLSEMVQPITGTNPNLTNREGLIHKLQEILKDKRFLLVLDDVWNEDQEKWECMEKDLREIGGSKGSKVIVTTRSNTVVSTMHASQTHPLGQLSDHHSWTLFKQRAFAKGGVTETPQFSEIGQRIVKRCGGVPLAIKALGGLLYSKNDEGEWLSIENSDAWSSSNNAEGVLTSIKLSYNHLPSLSLKQCFAYCSIYPKDTNMERENLIQLWMAQGFLNPPKGSHPLQMEDLGNGYFHILLRNSLLQDPTYDDSKQIESCKMHDVVHDFALDISKGYCATMKFGQDHNYIEGVHLSLIYGEEEIRDISQGISPNLRTLYIPSGWINSSVLLNFKYLRTLILCDFEIKQLPTSIGKLKLLRYIDVERTQINTLPASYIKLYNLQALRVRLADSNRIFLGALINLRHLYLGDTHEAMLVGIRKLIHLQFLPYFVLSDSEDCRIDELGPLDNLRGRLIIYGLDNVKNGEEAQKANIQRKPKVDYLELVWHWSRNELNCNHEDVLEGLRPHSNLKGLKIEGFKGLRFPSWMMRENNRLLHSLVEITLENCDSCEQLPPLGHLPHLKVVVIKGMMNVKCIGAEFYGCTANLDGPSCAFPALRRLELSSISNLEEWLGIEHPSMSSVNKAFPHLTDLIVKWCYKLINLPSLQGLSSLTELTFEELQNLFALPSLQGLSSLPKLTIQNIPNLAALPSLQGLSSLTELKIENLPKLVALPPLQSLSSLIELTIYNFPKLAALPSFQGLSSLKKLTIEKLPNLAALSSLQGLSSLMELIIFNLPNLTALPSLQGLSSLTELTIEKLPNLTTLPSLQGLLSLERMIITNCTALQGVDGCGLERLSNLEYLKIGGFSEELDYFPCPYNTAEVGEDDQLYFASLEDLQLYGWPKLTYLPEQIQYLPSLKSFIIYKFEGLEALPEWLGNILSLQYLEIWSCKNLKYMPSAEAMQCLTNLEKLHIIHCDSLKCTRGRDPEWHKIAHIPKIQANFSDIQSRN